MSSGRGSASPRAVQDGDVEMDVANTIEKPDAKVVIVTNLTRNVVQSHLRTIFGFYGEITKLDLPLFGKSGQNRGKAALEYSDAASAHKAASHMNGGQLDGAILKVELSDLPIRSRSRSTSRPPPPTRNRNGRGRSVSRSRSRTVSPRPYTRRRDTYEPRYNSYRGGRFGGRGGARSARDTYRPSSRSRSPIRRVGRLGPRRRSPSYERGGYGRRRRSRSASYSVRSSRSRSSSYSRSRSRSRSASGSSYSRYSRSRSRTRSASRKRSYSRDDIRDSRSRSPKD